ncbi:MAG: hypothetical protein H5U06_07435 [Candidatus Aminicenantes bacterium]|nr:hypothetical protein [Candidatus Aminicenantes bacterium]
MLVDCPVHLSDDETIAWLIKLILTFQMMMLTYLLESVMGNKKDFQSVLK